jgi:hypothetical protein
MSIKNSIKILLNNFSVVWKILVYQIIVIAISLALIASFVMPNIYTIYNSVKGTGLLHNAKEVINTFLERGDLTLSIEAFKTSLEEVSSILTEYDSLLILSMLFVLAIVVFGNLLSGMSELPVSDMINADMSANAKYGFCSRYIITLGKNLKYQLVRLITEIPAFVIIAFAVWQSFSFLFGYIGIFALFFCFALFVVLLSFLQAFLCLWVPEITVNKGNIFASIKSGFLKIKPRYFSIVSGYAFIDIFLFFMNIMLAFFTCGAGLLVSIPMSALFIIIFRMVIFYDVYGLKYYIDSNTIISPKDYI